MSGLPETLRSLPEVVLARAAIGALALEVPSPVYESAKRHVEAAQVAIWAEVLAEAAAREGRLRAALEEIMEESHVRGGEDALSCLNCHEILGMADEALAETEPE